MLLRETKLLTHYQNEWILDLRFRDKAHNYSLTSIEAVVFALINDYHYLACTLDTAEINKKDRVNRALKRPLYKINGVAYICHGSGSGHIGYFMDEFPDCPIVDPHPYQKHESFMDDVDTLYLSQAFIEKPVYTDQSYRSDTIYHWRDVPHWIGEDDTDVSLHVFERRPKEPIPLVMVQDKLF